MDPCVVTLNAAAGLAAWAALMVIFDTRIPGRVGRRALSVLAWPFEAVGRNALILYIGLTLAEGALGATPRGTTTLGAQLLAEHGAAWYAAVFIGGWLGIAFVMRASRWHIRL